MSTRTKEGDALQKMGATLNKVISQQSNAARFGSAASSAGFISSDTADGHASTTGVTEYVKVSKIMAAVKDHITMCGIGGKKNLEKVTEKYDNFVLLVYNELELTELAVQLVATLSKLKSDYVSPLPSDVHEGEPAPPHTQEPGSGASRENEAANETSNQASAVASSDSSTSVTLSELLDYVELSPSALKKKCTEEHLRDIAREMDNWEYYASNLGLSTGEIDDLKEEFRKTGVKKERCLLIWKQKAGFKANYGYLVNVFLRCKNAEMAEYVCRLLK